MAFEWDHAQIGWLISRFRGRSGRFADKVEVAGSALELEEFRRRKNSGKR